MKVADAHCDTLTKYNSNPFLTEQADWNMPAYKSVGGFLQFFAIFTPPELSGDAATAYALKHIGVFEKYRTQEINLIDKASDLQEDRMNILLSLEGASSIQNDINYLHAFYKAGVRAMGLTWNHRNFVADGIDNDYGLTVFGKEVVMEMEKIGMIIDVSHLNTNGFEDVVNYTSKPFIASHSNCRQVCEHKRNLYDEQIIEIKNRGGFIGLNFYADFLSEKKPVKRDLLRHTEHFLKLGCEDILGFGGDFDGMDRSPFKRVTDYNEIYDMFKNDLNLPESIIEKIFYKNLKQYIEKML